MTKCYVTVGSNDLERSYKYWDAVMEALGAKQTLDMPGQARAYALHDGFQIWVTKPQNGEAAACGNGHTIGIHAESTDAVDAAHAAAMANGGSDEGAPGPRPHYGPEFYGGYARDPEGNKMCFATFVEVDQ